MHYINLHLLTYLLTMLRVAASVIQLLCWVTVNFLYHDPFLST